MDSKERSLQILSDCINQLDNMTEEEIQKRLKETNLDECKMYSKEELNELLRYFYDNGGPIMDI